MVAFQWRRRLRILLRRGAVERAMDDELRYHIECETADRIARGVPPDEARRGAVRDFGGIEQVKESARDARGSRPIEDALADVRHALRLFRRNPMFTGAAIVTFALGIGATSTIFSVVYGVVYRPLPYRDPQRLVVLWERNVSRGSDRNVVSVANFEAWRARSRSFSAMAALIPRSATLPGDDAPERVAGADVSPGYFALLGVPPSIGRGFGNAENSPDATHEVILSDGYWKRRFGGDPAIVGRAIRVDGDPYTVLGVMPAGFEPPRFSWLGDQDLWFPFVPSTQSRAWGRAMLVVGRLRPDSSLASAGDELQSIAAQLETEVESDRGWSARVEPLSQVITGDVRTPFIVVLAAVGLLLLVTIVNVGALTLALLKRREHELAIRRALGASDRRIFRQLFTQSVLLGAAGAAIGVSLTWPGLRLLRALLPPDLPRLGSIRVDATVLSVATLVALAATVLFGTASGLRLRAPTLSRAPAPAGNRASAPRSGGTALVVTEIAVALAIGVMATLMVRSYAALRSVELGFAPNGVLAARLSLPGDRYRSPESQRAFYDTLLEGVRALPGVEAAGITSRRPFGGMDIATSVRDARDAPPSESPGADIRYADRALFSALKIPVTRGTNFSGDRPAGPAEAIVTDNLARILWPAVNPIGQQLMINLNGGLQAEVIGVVPDLHLASSRAAARPAVYLSRAQYPSGTNDLVVRTSGNPMSLVAALRSEVTRLEPDAPVYDVTALGGLVDSSLASDRFATWLLSAFAGLALLLGGVGVFGICSSEVTRRRREIGIRMALGASARGVVLMILWRVLAHAAAGILVGILLALGLTRAMTSLLFGVSATDLTSFTMVMVAVASLAAVATLIPAIQAVRAAPLAALREN